MQPLCRTTLPLDSEEGGSDEMARQRPSVMHRNLKNLSTEDDVYLSNHSHSDPSIDFSSAGLYLVGLQTTVATVACAAASVASCWLLPLAAISAVRTLVITCGVGFLFMRKPIRIGRVRGVATIFNALRPCVIIYVGVLVLEQLVHTCVANDREPPGSTRHVVFHMMISCMMVAGLVRAYRPLSETDAPFLVTAGALVVVAMMPPPATPLTGPLCEAASLFMAGERLLRAFLFAALYVVQVYCSPPKQNTIHDLTVCIMRCGAAAVWVLGCHLFLIWIGCIQAFLALWARFGHEQSGLPTTHYSTVDTHSDSGLSDAELGIPPPPILSNGLPVGYAGNNGYSNSGYGNNGYYVGKELDRAPTPEATSSLYSCSSDGVPVDAASLASMAAQVSAGPMSKERLAQIAAGLT